MTRRLARLLGLSSAVILLMLCTAGRASAAVITFDDLADLDLVTNQYLGVTFQNARVLAAGGSLNDVDFPPLSGANVVMDFNGPIVIDFATAVDNFAGYFTYVAPLTLTAYDSGGNLIGTVASILSSNLATPNELLSFSLVGIGRIQIAGDSFGGSFTLDDVSYEVPVQSVPEPASLALLLTGFGVVLAARSRHALRRR